MSEQIVAPGKYVGITYSITDDVGNVVEQHDIPVGFVYGSDTELVGGLDKAVAGKKAGDEVEVKLSPDDAYGPYDPSLTFTDVLENVPPQFRRVGAEVQMQNEKGEVKTFHVSQISDGKLTVDGNHPLAGKELTVHVKIVEVRDAKPGEEKVSGIHAVQAPTHPTIN
ncbi:MAG: peptidylprolyl isomerase [Gammaproteobacteria bacterium]|nr:MAG: peptidylprolyl isomerase [Gammaproteobacteria bacterium]